MVSELPPRPEPRVPLAHRVREWARWIGPGRLLATAVVVPLVGVGAWWLVRPPDATTESRLPYTSAVSSTVAGAPSATTTTPADGDGDSAAVVHVAGAVAVPGVYTLSAGSRVIDAVNAAGGLAVDADSDAINLAAVLSDGQRIYVPTVGEVVPPSVSADGTVAPGPVDLNRATVDELETLPGVGPATAAAIVAYRDSHGPFASVDALADVSGIGPAKLAAIRELVTV